MVIHHYDIDFSLALARQHQVEAHLRYHYQCNDDRHRMIGLSDYKYFFLQDNHYNLMNYELLGIDKY